MMGSHRYQNICPFFLCADVAAGLSSHRGHQFLEADEVEHPFEVVGQRRQTPFASYFGQSFEQEVGVAKPPLDRPEGMFGQRLS